MFGAKQRRIKWLEHKLAEAEEDVGCYKRIYDRCLAHSLSLQKELRVTNKACRNKRKLSKALHEANSHIKALTQMLANNTLTWAAPLINKPPNCDGMEGRSP